MKKLLLLLLISLACFNEALANLEPTNLLEHGDTMQEMGVQEVKEQEEQENQTPQENQRETQDQNGAYEEGESSQSSQNLDSQINNLKEEIRQMGGEPSGNLPARTSSRQGFYRKNGFFLGINGGFGNVNNSYEDGKYNRENEVQGAVNTGVLIPSFTTGAFLPLFGGKLGYQNFFNNAFGVRLYGDVLLGSGALKSGGKQVGSMTYMLGGLNLDLLAEYALGSKFDIGGFGGLGFGLILLGDEAKNMDSLLLDGRFSSPNILWKNLLEVDYAFNVGITLTYLKKHRLELMMKIPITFLRLGLEKPALYTSPTEEKILTSKDIDFSRSSHFVFSYVYVF